MAAFSFSNNIRKTFQNAAKGRKWNITNVLSFDFVVHYYFEFGFHIIYL